MTYQRFTALPALLFLAACQAATPTPPPPTPLCDQIDAYDASVVMTSSEGTVRIEASFSGYNRKGTYTIIGPDGGVDLVEEYVIKDGTWYGRELIDTGRSMDGPDEWAIVSEDAGRDFVFDAALFCSGLLAGPFEPRGSSDDEPDHTTDTVGDNARVIEEYWVDETGYPTRVRRTITPSHPQYLPLEVTYSGFDEPNAIVAPAAPTPGE